ncbi:MAG: hypothetical protein OEM97_04165 [Acidimicrobiia bacterium]|nr:hypothetical protein [Acidimicrobiia bacterium]
MSSAVLAVVVPPELENGFLLAGVTTIVASTSIEAARETSRLLQDAPEGVVAVYEPFLAAFEPGMRVRAETSLAPVMVPLASGVGDMDADARHAQLSKLLSRAVGYHITFDQEEA